MLVKDRLNLQGNVVRENQKKKKKKKKKPTKRNGGKEKKLNSVILSEIRGIQIQSDDETSHFTIFTNSFPGMHTYDLYKLRLGIICDYGRKGPAAGTRRSDYILVVIRLKCKFCLAIV